MIHWIWLFTKKYAALFLIFTPNISIIYEGLAKLRATPDNSQEFLKASTSRKHPKAFKLKVPKASKCPVWVSATLSYTLLFCQTICVRFEIAFKFYEWQDIEVTIRKAFIIKLATIHRFSSMLLLLLQKLSGPYLLYWNSG